MAFLIKISKRYSCDFSYFFCPQFLGEGLEKLWREEWSGGGKRRRRPRGGTGCRLPQWRGSAHLAACLSAGVPVPALFPHPQHTELSGKHCRRRKARTVFSDSQLSGLEKRFEIQRYLSTPERVELATALSLSETQVGPGGASIPALPSSPLLS